MVLFGEVVLSFVEDGHALLQGLPHLDEHLADLLFEGFGQQMCAIAA